MSVASLGELETLCQDLPSGDEGAATAAENRQDVLTKPRRSLGRLEELVIWLARWQRRAMPVLDKVEVLIFAGTHGVTARGISAFPSEVTGQMVGNYAAGGAAINQLARQANASLRVFPLSVENPTADFTTAPAMQNDEFLEAVNTGYEAVDPDCNLVCLGEMGIGNTTVAAAVCLGLFGGSARDWTGLGTGVDEAGLARKIAAVEGAVCVNRDRLGDPLSLLAALGGRELAAIFGAALACRRQNIPVIVDGFVATAAVAPLARLAPGGLDHAVAGHLSSENAHRALLAELNMRPLLDLDMRLGEGSGAAVAINILRSALACHAGMATFAQAGVSDRATEEPG